MRRHWAELFLRDSQSEEETRGALEVEAHTLRVRGSGAQSGALLRRVSIEGRRQRGQDTRRLTSVNALCRRRSLVESGHQTGDKMDG
jgi:hypothetical protein